MNSLFEGVFLSIIVCFEENNIVSWGESMSWFWLLFATAFLTESKTKHVRRRGYSWSSVE